MYKLVYSSEVARGLIITVRLVSAYTVVRAMNAISGKCHFLGPVALKPLDQFSQNLVRLITSAI